MLIYSLIFKLVKITVNHKIYREIFNKLTVKIRNFDVKI